MPTNWFDAATLTAFDIFSRWTGLQHSEVTQRKIILDRIVRIETRERGRDFFRRLEIRCFAQGQADVAR